MDRSVEALSLSALAHGDLNFTHKVVIAGVGSGDQCQGPLVSRDFVVSGEHNIPFSHVPLLASPLLSVL